MVGFDHSPRMAQICRERVGQGEFRVHDLGDPIAWLPDGGVDLVLCALAFSRQHPTGDWLRHGGSYFDVRIIHETWSKGWQVRYWVAPLETTCEEISAAGFVIERLLEPRPVPEAAAIDPEEYQRLAREPRGFMAFRLRPRP